MSDSRSKTRAALVALPFVMAAAVATSASAQETYDATQGTWDSDHASSAHDRSWYVGGQGSAVFQRDSDADGAVNFSTEYDTGYGLGGIVGYDFANGFRAEAELGYQNSDIDNGGGHDSALFGLVSGYYDFDLGQSWKPYLGGGVGYADVNMDGTPAGTFAVDDSDEVPIWALAAGVGYDLNPRTTLFAGYRYIAAIEEPSFTNSAGQSFDLDYSTHNVQAGVRYKF